MAEYWLREGSKKFGPLSFEDISVQLYQGNLSYMTQVYDGQDGIWIPIIMHRDFVSTKKIQDDRKTSSEIPKWSGEPQDCTEEFPSGTTHSSFMELERFWHIEGDQSQRRRQYRFLDLMALLQSGSLKEYQKIQDVKTHKWRKVSEWPEFQPETLEAFMKTNPDLEGPVHFRRGLPRNVIHQPVYVYSKKELHKGVCVDLNIEGMGFYILWSGLHEFETAYVKFGDRAKGKRFDARVQILSKFQTTFNDKRCIKYGAQFVELSKAAREMIQEFNKAAQAS